MKKLSSKKEIEFLSGEISDWLELNLITPEQSEKILSLYEIKNRNLRMIFFIAGGILLGLGAVSFIAAHWHELPKIFRVCVIAAAWLMSMAAYSFFGMSKTKAGRAFYLLASVIFGSGIFLITRMYNIKLSWQTITGWWIIQVLISGVSARDEWQIYFSQVLSFLYLNGIDAIDLFALEFGNLPRISILEFFATWKAFALIISLWLAWRIVNNDRVIFSANMFLTLLLLASRMSLCFGGTWTLIILVLAGAVLSLISHWHDPQIFGVLMLGLFGLLLTWPEFWRGEIFSDEILGFSGKSFWPVATAIFVALMMLFNIYRGLTAPGIIFCTLLAARYFFDHFFGYMPKAWGFTLIGIAMLILGMFFERVKRIFNTASKN